MEYFYGQRTDHSTGVSWCKPRALPDFVFRERIFMGRQPPAPPFPRGYHLLFTLLDKPKDHALGAGN